MLIWRHGRMREANANSFGIAAFLFVAGAAAIAAPVKQLAPLDLTSPAAPGPWSRYPGWSSTTWDEYSDLAHSDRTPKAERKILPIAGLAPGDPQKGRELAFQRSRGGGCVACHVMGPATPETPGNVGPDLSAIGAAGRSDRYLFDYIYDPRSLNRASVMPPWGAHRLYGVEEILDMVAFLKTLRAPTVFADRLNDPERRPSPVENRDALDPFVNPGIERVHAGESLVAAAGPNGLQCISCHKDPKTAFSGWAAAMPRWEARLGKVLGVEEFVFRHAKATTGGLYLMGEAANVDLSVFLHFLSYGQPIRIDTASAPAQQALREGKRLYNTKIGQLNFSCADCHDSDKGANKWIRAQFLGETR